VLNKKVTCQASQAKDTHWFNLMKMYGPAGERGAGREGKEKEWKSRFADPVSFEQYPLGSRLIAIPACYL